MRINNKLVVALDLETHLPSDDEPYPKPVVVVVRAADAPAELSLDVERTCGRWLAEAAAGRAIVVFHHARYDMGVLLTRFPALGPLIWDAYEANGVADTRVRELLIDIANDERRRDFIKVGHKKVGPYTLGRIAERRLRVHLDKDEDSWRYRYAELDGVALSYWPEDAKAYVLADGDTTYALYVDQEERAARCGGIPTQWLETRADFALGLTSSWGMLVDGEQVDRFDVEIAEQKEIVAHKLAKLGLVSLERGTGITDLFGQSVPSVWKKNAKAIREMAERTWRGLGEHPRTGTGQLKADETVLRDCVGADAELLREYNKLESTGSRFLKGLRGLKGRRTRANFQVLGADSSRTSASDPNLQQLPRRPGARECFIAAPGHALISSDFDGQETRTWADSCVLLTGSSAIADRFNADPDYDAHTDIACHLLGIHYDEGMRRKGKDAAFDDVRQTVKPATFGFPVGMGAQKYVLFARNQGVETTLAEAQRLRDVFYEARPETRPYLDVVSATVGAAGYGTQVTPQSGFRRGGVGFTDCANGFFQTPAAHASKEALWRVVRRCYDDRLLTALLGSRPVNFVHDEVILETPLFAVHEAGEEFERQMVIGMETWIKNVPCRAGVTAMRRWSKKAKRVVENGRLVPCN